MQFKIYLVMNRTNFKKYVGLTSRTVARRFYEHSINRKSAIGLAIQKYGRDNFLVVVIETCETLEKANEREKYWIAFHDCIAPSGYNRTSGGETYSFSEETLHNMSEGQKRRYSNPAEHEKSSKAQKRRAQTPEGRADLLAASAKAKELAEIKRHERESQLPPKNPRKSEAARNRAATPEGHANIMKAVAKSVASRAAKIAKKNEVKDCGKIHAIGG